VNSTLSVDPVPPACNFPIRKFRISSYCPSVVDAGVPNSGRLPEQSTAMMINTSTMKLPGKVAMVTGVPRGITVNNVQPGPVDTDMNPANGPFAETLKNFMDLKR
jgi:3-oxoacyl-[acyl-carrier protein] reductase